ncbi:NAD(P)H-hydrate dehydratase [Bacillaceae bacterium Marseille-Q3522]|nr:NAD(P)H-hydrate dehydratase [Bacillaceae bacterium Marseille-Q3522]
MYIYTGKQIKEADHLAGLQGMPVFTLMENAGNGLFQKIKPLLAQRDRILILAGKGNNGGDAIVLARYLQNHHYHVDVVCPFGEPKTETAQQHLAYFRACGYELAAFDRTKNYDWIIEGILGVGTSLPLRENVRKLTRWINSIEANVISIDIPTGVSSDTGEADEDAVQAGYTFSLHGFKPSAFLYPAASNYGKTAVCEIGLVHTSKWRLWTEEDVKHTFLKREANTHKGTFGTGLLVAGCDEMPGSAALAGAGALRFGIGKLSILTSKFAASAIAPLVPEATYLFQDIQGSYTAAAIGSGLPPDEKSEEKLRVLLKKNLPLIIDAGALQKRTYPKREAPIIITPHPGEFSRLTGLATKQIQKNRLQLASQYAVENKVIVVLKGSFSVIAFPDGSLYVNPTGNNSLAKGGSGDTLTGMLLAGVCQYNNINAAVANTVFIHGACADEWVRYNSSNSLTAHDLGKLIGKVCAQIEGV